jgi:hypothetical protein
MIDFRTIYAILDHTTLAQSTTERVWYVITLVRILRSLNQRKAPILINRLYDTIIKTLMVLNYAYAKIYRNVVVDEKLDF